MKKETIFGSKLTQDAEVGQKRKWDDGEENQVEICSKKVEKSKLYYQYY